MTLDKYGNDPDQIGRVTAQALIASLESLKGREGGGADAPLEDQLRAGLAAVEAMKDMLRGAVISTQPRDS